MLQNGTTNQIDAESSYEDEAASMDSVNKLRSILLHSEREEIESLKQQIEALQFRLSDAKTRTAEASEIMAKVTRLAHKNDAEFSASLKPIVVEQFQTSSRENPEIMAEALFPILGPAIRKMIASMLSLDKSKTKRTYKFEQLFLIEKESGLPICHAKSESSESQDADMVSGMLSAIQSFVQDAFQTQEFDGLNTLQLGELSVWIEWGPSAVVAAVIRGVAPESCRTSLQELLEDIHTDYSQPLAEYEGDSAVFDPIKPDFLLFMENHDSRLKNRVRNMSTASKNWSIAALLAFASLFAWNVYNYYDKSRWNDFVTQLDAVPGIVITKSERTNGNYTLHGLKDPLATPPIELLKNTSLDIDKVNLNLEPYQALSPDFTLKRLQLALIPPDGVRLSLIGTELVIEGAQSKSWIARAKTLATQFTEVSHVTVLP